MAESAKNATYGKVRERRTEQGVGGDEGLRLVLGEGNGSARHRVGFLLASFSSVVG